MVTPRRSLSTLDAIAMVVGIVIGAGIFGLPPYVAANVDGPTMFMAVWIVGGLISLAGALCYAELAATYPNTGGDYHFLMRAFGPAPAFLFAWARMTVIQTGAIALTGFIIGDYVANALVDPAASPNGSQFIASLTAATVVVGLTLLNMAGVREGKSTQKALTALAMAGLLLIVAAGAMAFLRDDIAASPAHKGERAFGMALVFVLYTYGGWNEAAYLSAEMKGGRRSIVAALAIGLAAVTAVYLLVNLAFLASLGLAGTAESSAVAADTLAKSWGTGSALLITAIFIIAALSTANATVFTGARTNYALGRDFTIFRFLGRWSERSSTPRNALLVQGLIALFLVGLGAFTRDGVRSMVDYTWPVFWFFFLLVGVSLFVLRYKDPDAERPFRVPLYPLLPLVFCGVCGYMLYSSWKYAGVGTWFGVGVLAVGVPIMLVASARRGNMESGAPIAPAADAADAADE